MTSVTVVVPMTIRRCGGRKRIIGPDGAPIRVSGDAAETRGDPALVKALARAFRWQRLLEEGWYGSISEMATAERIDRGYLGRLLQLTLLAPDIVDAILHGRQPRDLSLPALMEIISVTWAEQRLGFQGGAEGEDQNVTYTLAHENQAAGATR